MAIFINPDDFVQPELGDIAIIDDKRSVPGETPYRRVYMWDGKQWEEVPEPPSRGDVKFEDDENGKQRVYVWNGEDWVEFQDMDSRVEYLEEINKKLVAVLVGLRDMIEEAALLANIYDFTKFRKVFDEFESLLKDFTKR